MYAIIEDGSRQYRVSEGEVVKVDFRRSTSGGELEGMPAGTAVEFDRVLLYRNGDELKIGQPTVEGMRVVAEVVDHPSTKVYIQKFRRRKNYRRLRGHRQYYTSVRVKHILLPGQQAPKTTETATQTTPASEASASSN